MNACVYSLLTWTVLACSAEADPSALPVTFCRSGRNATVAVSDDGAQTLQGVVLRAYGRDWANATKGDLGKLQVRVPAVRVPTLFTLAAANSPTTILGEVVAYPPGHKAGWDAKIPLFVADGSPAWMRQWLEAVGVRYTMLETDDRKPAVRTRTKNGLLISGATAAGNSIADILLAQRRHRMNTLVVDASWFGTTKKRQITWKHFGWHEIVRFVGQEFDVSARDRLTFTSMTGPWPAVANRQSWMSDRKTSMAFVEEVHASRNQRRIILSYLPWWQQLGRNQACDRVLLAMMHVVSRESADHDIGDVSVRLLWPPQDDDWEKDRPVLAAVMKVQADRGGERDRKLFGDRRFLREPIGIVDVRGPPLDEKQLRSLQATIKQASVLRAYIMGSDPSLSNERGDLPKDSLLGQSIKLWQQIDSEDTLPSSVNTQIKLMQVMTRFGADLRASDLE